jgi:hypothetical protein
MVPGIVNEKKVSFLNISYSTSDSNSMNTAHVIVESLSSMALSFKSNSSWVISFLKTET